MLIALLIPCTSRNRDAWQDIRDTYLYKLSLMTFFLTQDREHQYTVYIGYDADDRIFATSQSHNVIIQYSKSFPNVSFRFIRYENIRRGHLTKMWNILYKQAFDDGCDYFYQCGDDISFKTTGWVNDSIKTLKLHNDIGITGPVNNNTAIMTQVFFSRKHMEIFGWLFPEEIINWCCDDWYNIVYKPNYFYPLMQHYCSNEGGVPRYDINGDPGFIKNRLAAMTNVSRLRENTTQLANNHKILIHQYISRVPRLSFIQPPFALSQKLRDENKNVTKANFEMVVARYDEDIRWTENYAKFRTVYNKGSAAVDYDFIPLPNKGHLADTILRHIINNYDKLADVTFFTHGSINYRPDQIIEENGKWDEFITTDENALVYIRRTDLPKDDERIYEYPETIGEVYRRLFEREYIPNFEWACGKWISAGRNQLRRCPKAFYQKMLDFVLEECNDSQLTYRTRGIFIERFIIHAIVSA